MFASKIAAVAACAVGATALGVVLFGILPAGVQPPVSPGANGTTASRTDDQAVQAQLAQQVEAMHAQLTKQDAAFALIAARLARIENAQPSALAPSGGAREQTLVDPAVDESERMTPAQMEEQIREEREAAMQVGRQRLAALDDGWSSESIDRGWAQPYEEDVWTALHSPDLGSLSVTDVSCRSSVCKLELRGDPTVDAVELNAKLVELEPFQNTEFTTTMSEGGEPGQVVIYLARPGGQGLSQLASSPQ
jgi:hypothetical protein